MSSVNPYQPPLEVSPGVVGKSPRDATAQEVFLAWEKLRLPYNIVLVLVTLGALGLVGVGVGEPRELLAMVVGGALIANLCFCAGPCVEGYLAWMGAQRRITRTIIFALGLVLASLLALVEVGSLAGQPF